MTKLSISIPVYNAENFLDKCLESILNQSFTDYEIIVVNDCSPGDCCTYMQKYSDNNKIIYHKHETNKGALESRHTGANLAKGEYLLFIDADDYLMHNTVLEDLINMLKGEDILAFNYIYQYSTGELHRVEQEYHMYDKVLNTHEEKYWELFKGGMPNGLASKLIKKSCWDKYITESKSTLNSNLSFGEDILVLFYLLYFSSSVRTTSYTGYIYNRHESSSTVYAYDDNKKFIKNMTEYIEVWKLINLFIESKFTNTPYANILKQYVIDRKQEDWGYLYSRIQIFPRKSYQATIEVLKKALHPLGVYEDIRKDIENKTYINPTCKISIVMPVFNTEPFLRRCVDSIINQGFTDYEIIVIDDCSPKNCKEIIENYENPKISYHKNPMNMGATWSRLHGLSKSSGEYVYFVDSDDWLVENSLQDMFNHVKNGEFDVLYFNGYFATEEKHWKDNKGKDYILKEKEQAFDHFFGQFQNNERKTLWCRLFKRDVISKGALYMPMQWLSVADDWLLNIFSLWYADSLKSVNEYYYYYYQENPNAISNHVENRSMKKSLSPEKANKYMQQIEIVYTSMERFLIDKGIMSKYAEAWKHYLRDKITYHLIPMIDGVEQFFSEEIINNPEKALTDMRNMTHNRLSVKNVLKTTVNYPHVSAKDAVKILINKIKGRNKFIGYIIEKITLIMWRIYKKVCK